MDENYKKFIFTLNKLFSSWIGKWKPNQLNHKGQDILYEIQKNYQIPKELTYLYLGFKDEQDSIRYQELSFLDLKTMNKHATTMREDGQMDYVDIGMSYAGMGHSWVLSWHKEERKYFIRMDGGSNIYDVKDNYERYVINKIDWNTLRTKKINVNEEQKDLLMEWKDLIYILQSSESLRCRSEYPTTEFIWHKMNIGNYL